jgi:spore coat protein A, manganese oxidase
MMHCHNTVHEDHDMMGQFEMGPGPDPFSAPARNLPEGPLDESL